MDVALDLNKLAVEVRPRSAWEAVDLGCLMAKRWWWPLVKIWFVLSFPVWLLLAFLPLDYLWLQALIIWWLKPIFERGLLDFLSRAVFSDEESTKNVVRTSLKLCARQWFSSLTWRRLSPSRSMDLAVVQLENLGGEERSQRLAILHREDARPAGWLTVIGVHIEIFLAIGVFLLLMAMIPNTVEFDMAEHGLEYLSGDVGRIFWWVNNGLGYLAALCVGPYYVASGFALYLNRRVRLEAWDLDIAFRRIAAKRTIKTDSATKQSPGLGNTLSLIFATVSTALISTILFASLSIAPLSFVYAEDSLNNNFESTKTSSKLIVEPPKYKNFDEAMILSSGSKVNAENAKYTINYIESGPAFHENEILRYPNFSWLKLDEIKDKDELDNMGILPLWAATLLELAFWCLVACCVFYIIYRYRYWFAQFVGEPGTVKQKKKPSVLFGMDVAKQSLPENLEQQAKKMCENGDFRGGLALLYRGCLSYLISTGYDLEESFTEQECLAFVKQLQPKISASNQAQKNLALEPSEPSSHAFSHISALSSPAIRYLTELTRVWRRLAYAHMNPSLSEAITLCDNWSEQWLARRDTDDE